MASAGSGVSWEELKTRKEEIDSYYEGEKKEKVAAHKKALQHSSCQGKTNGLLHYMHDEDMRKLEERRTDDLKKLSYELNNWEMQVKQEVRQQAAILYCEKGKEQALRLKQLQKKERSENRELSEQRHTALNAVGAHFEKLRNELHALLEPSMSRADQNELSVRACVHQFQMSVEDEDEPGHTPWKQTIQTCKFGGVTVTCTMYQGVKQNSRAQWVSEELINLPGVTDRMIDVFNSLESTPDTFQEPPAHGRLPGTLVTDRSLMKAFTTKATWSALVSCKHAKTRGTMSHMYVYVTGSLTQNTLISVGNQLDRIQPPSPLQVTCQNVTFDFDRVTHANNSMSIRSAPLEEEIVPHSSWPSASDSPGSEAAPNAAPDAPLEAAAPEAAVHAAPVAAVHASPEAAAATAAPEAAAPDSTPEVSPPDAMPDATPDAAPEESQQALCSSQEVQCEQRIRAFIEKCLNDNGFPVVIVEWVKL